MRLSLRSATRLISAAVRVAATGHGGLEVASAQGAPLDPRAIALTPSDVAPGIVVSPEETAFQPLTEEVGVQFRTVMNRANIREPSDGSPMQIRQTILRFDRQISAAEFLPGFVDYLMQGQGTYRIAPDGPNDAMTTSFVQMVEGNPNVGYTVVFLKNDMVVGVTVVGDQSSTTATSATELARRIESRYDALVSPPTGGVAQPTSTDGAPTSQPSDTQPPDLSARCSDVAVRESERNPGLGASASNVVEVTNELCRIIAAEWGEAGITCVETAVRSSTESSAPAGVLNPASVLNSCLSNLSR